MECQLDLTVVLTVAVTVGFGSTDILIVLRRQSYNLGVELGDARPQLHDHSGLMRVRGEEIAVFLGQALEMVLDALEVHLFALPVCALGGAVLGSAALQERI